MTGSLFLYGGLIFGASLAGGAVPLLVDMRRPRTRQFLGISAGILLGAVFFHVLPDAFAVGGATVGLAVVAGFLTLYLLERFLLVHVCDAGDCEFHTLGATALLGLSVHALTEGVALGAGLQTADLGLPVAIAILAHKAPASFTLVAILLAEGTARRRVLMWIAVFAALVPIGAVLWQVLSGAGGTGVVQAAALGFSAGTFLHIAVSDLLPELHRSEAGGHGAAGALHVLGGIALMYGVSWVS